MTAKTLEEEATAYALDEAKQAQKRHGLTDLATAMYMEAAELGFMCAALDRDKEIEELRAKLASMREPIWMLREEHDAKIASLRAKLEAVPVEEIKTAIEYSLQLPSDYEELKAAETVVQWLAGLAK